MAEKKNCILGKILLTGAGIALAGAAAAAAGVAVGLKKWADDEDASELKLVYGKDYGLRIVKGEKPGEYQVETRYDWQNDPEMADVLEDEDEDEDEAEEELEEDAPAAEPEVEAVEEAPAPEASEEAEAEKDGE